MACSWAIIGIGLAGAYLLPLSGFPAGVILLHPVSMVFWLALRRLPVCITLLLAIKVMSKTDSFH